MTDRKACDGALDLSWLNLKPTRLESTEIDVRYCLYHPDINFCWFDDVDHAKEEARKLPGSELVAFTYESKDAVKPMLMRKVRVTGRPEV